MGNNRNRNRPPTPQGQVVVQQTTHSMAWSGPTPPPEVLGKFETLMPGSAQLILNNAIHESEHRREMEKQVVGNHTFELATQRMKMEKEARQNLVAIVPSALGLLIFLAGGIYMLVIGKSPEGWGAIGLAAAAIYWGRRTKQP